VSLQLASAALTMLQVLEPKQIQTTAQVDSLDQRLASDQVSQPADPYIDQLYENLKELWVTNPNITPKEIIAQLSKFTAADKVQPYRSIRTHAVALAQIMRILKEEGGEGAPVYAALKKGVGFGVVSNGILDSFIAKMMQGPEEMDPW